MSVREQLKHIIACLFAIAAMHQVSMAALVTSVGCGAQNDMPQAVSKRDEGTNSASADCVLTAGNIARAQATAEASYGQLRTQVTATVGPIVNTGRASSSGSAIASYSDTFTILGSGAGAIRVSLFFSLGSLDASGSAGFQLGDYSMGASCFCVMGPPPVQPAIVPIEFGVPISISAALVHFGYGSLIRAERSMASFSFRQSLQVLDASGQPMTSVQYISEAGVTLPFLGGLRYDPPSSDDPISSITGSSIPEPSTLLLFLTAVGIFRLKRLTIGRSFRVIA